MPLVFRTLARWGLAFFDPRKLLSWKYVLRYISHWRRFRAMSGEPLRLADSYPCLLDWVSTTPYDSHYLYQGGWLARRIAVARPELHVDVGSSVQTLSVLSAQVPIVFVDYRPLNAHLDNLICVGGNIVSLPFADASLQSVSCMHVIEHIGLGRYGDPLDSAGADKAAAEIQRVLAPGGTLYLTAPVGRERVCFNAHRVFSPYTFQKLMPGLILLEFSWVSDDGTFYERGEQADAVGLDYGCGMYVFGKSQ
jgi:SAM-dependent methyltransferase